MNEQRFFPESHRFFNEYYSLQINQRLTHQPSFAILLFIFPDYFCGSLIKISLILSSMYGTEKNPGEEFFAFH